MGGGPVPAPPAKDTNYIYSDVIILLTDGLNTQDRWYTDQTSIDARQQLTCDNINAAKITLYTIQVNTGGDPTSHVAEMRRQPGKIPRHCQNFVVTASSGSAPCSTRSARSFRSCDQRTPHRTGAPPDKHKARPIGRAFSFRTR